MKYLEMMFSKKFLLILIPIIGLVVVLTYLFSSYELLTSHFFNTKASLLQKLTSGTTIRVFLATTTSFAMYFIVLGYVYNYIKKK